VEGWKGKQNGELLRLLEGRFDVFVRSDGSVEHQQNLLTAASRSSSSRRTILPFSARMPARSERRSTKSQPMARTRSW
jgi:hypothetical protein